MTDTTKTTVRNQTITNAGNTESKTEDDGPGNKVDDTESGIRDNSPGNGFDDTEIEGDGVEVRFQDGRTWKIIGDFYWDKYDSYDFELTGDCE